MADGSLSTSEEYTGRTVEEAINSALRALNVRRDQLEISVVSEGRPGILGVGAQPARIRAAALPEPPRPRPITQFADEDVASAPAASWPFDDEERAAAPDDGEVAAEEDEEVDIVDIEEEDEEVEEPEPVAPPVRQPRPPRAALPEDIGLATESAVDVLETLLQLMGFSARVTPREPVTPGDGAGLVAAVLDVSGAQGQDAGLLIGRKGETLAALQYMLNLIVNHQTHAHSTFGVDVEGYRQRREIALEELARRVADRVRQNGQPMTLEPMPAAERRIVHLVLAEDPDVQTVSIGEGEARKVAITPRK